jgi:hypothetical protein
MAAQHSSILRGIEEAGGDPTLRGARFGRLFPTLPAATYGDTTEEENENLTNLAAAMDSPFDKPKDGPDPEESGIPALYTYFGQFVDHDLTFDPDSSFQKQKDPPAQVDFRTPAFDLDNLYGRGPGDQPYMYADDGKSLLLGDPLTLGDAKARDLQRNSAGRALIGDPRNDENAIVSQFQGLMLRFHNGMVHDHPHASFEEVQALVRHHYQYVVVNDYLPRIVNATVLNDLKTNGAYDEARIRFFKDFGPPYHTPYMPLEFSVAAYRLGHSMVRPAYRLNDATLLPIFPLPARTKPGFPEGLTGFRRMISDWGIDWGRFIDIDERAYGIDTDAPTPDQAVENFARLQFAYRIDTALVKPLGRLPNTVAANRPHSLAARNLIRGRNFNLPSGQAVATAMGVTPLKQIMIGQDVATPTPALRDIVHISPVFENMCPLWTYILAEARHHHQNPAPAAPVIPARTIDTPQLGPVGGRIVAEVFLELMFADPGAYLSNDPEWRPAEGSNYKLRDLVRFALAH